MDKKSMMNFLCDQRMVTALEERLLQNESYKKSVRIVNKQHQRTKNGLKESQKKALDDFASAINDCSSEYGRAAYCQGLEDGMCLMAEVFKLPFLFHKEE